MNTVSTRIIGLQLEVVGGTTIEDAIQEAIELAMEKNVTVNFKHSYSDDDYVIEPSKIVEAIKNRDL